MTSSEKRVMEDGEVDVSEGEDDTEEEPWKKVKVAVAGVHKEYKQKNDGGKGDQQVPPLLKG